MLIITCPSCSSEYMIEPDRVGSGGSKVRCARCGGTWFATATARADESPATIGQSGTAVIEAPSLIGPPAGRRKPGRSAGGKLVQPGRFGRAAAIVVAGATLLSAPAAIAFRAPLVRAAPESAGFFAAIGWPVNLIGLDLSDIVSGTGEEDGRKVLFVDGTIVNVAKSTVTLPRLALAVEGADGARLYEWTARPPRPELAAGQTARFRVRLASPPPLGSNVVVTFAAGQPSPVASR